MDRVKKNKKKGFTLVELMIVVVIMVILAAAASPIFKGYLDRAKEAGYLANCRTMYVATQTVIQDYDIAGKLSDLQDASPITIDASYTKPSTQPFTDPETDIQKLAQVEISGDSYVITISGTECTEVKYINGSTTVTFTPKEGSLTSATAAPSSGGGSNP